MEQECRGSSFNGTIKAKPQSPPLAPPTPLFLTGCGFTLLLQARKRIHTSLSFKCGISYSTLLKKEKKIELDNKLHVNAVWQELGANPQTGRTLKRRKKQRRSRSVRCSCRMKHY